MSELLLTQKNGMSYWFSYSPALGDKRTILTIDQAKTLKTGDIIFLGNHKFKVTSIKTYKRNQLRITIGVKYGLFTYAQLTENDIENFSR